VEVFIDNNLIGGGSLVPVAQFLKGGHSGPRNPNETPYSRVRLRNLRTPFLNVRKGAGRC